MNYSDYKILSEYDKYLTQKNVPKINRQKILIIFSFWIVSFNYFNNNFSKEKKRKLLNYIKKKKLFLPNVINEFEINCFKTKSLTGNKNYAWLQKFLFNFKKLNLLFGLNSNKIQYLYSYFYLKYKVFLRKDFSLKEKKYFVDLINEKKFLKKSFKNLFFNLLPDNFFQNYFPIIKNTCIKDYTINFLFQNHYLNLFFLSKNLTILGFQHGNGYQFFKDNEYYKMEKNISNKFFNLFPFSQDFGRFNKEQLKIKTSPRLIWVLRKLVSEFNIKNLGYYGELSKSKKNLKRLDKNLSNLKNLCYSINDNNFLFKPKWCKQIAYYNKKIENIVASNDIIIFDNIAPSFLHYVLLNNIVFFIVLPVKFDKKKIHYKYLQMLSLLRKKNFLFYIDEFNLFKKEINLARANNNHLNKKKKDLKKIKNFFKN